LDLTPEFLALLRCPVTGEALERAKSQLRTPAGEHCYPVINGVPWVLPNARNSLLDWGAKLNHFRQVLVAELTQLEREARKAPAHTVRRLQTMHSAKHAFLKGVIDLILPVVSAQVAEKSLYDVLRDRAPSIQNLLSYEANLYRDWIWGDEENQQSAALVADRLGASKPQQRLILGAGSGRLAYDVHRALGSGTTVATDINPLLLMAAERIFSGHDFTLYEFPAQPRDAGHIAVEQAFKGLAEWPDKLHLAFADAANSPFAPHTFDAVITPWLIDIQPYELGRFLRQLNQYVPVGGQWINFGSLVFNQNRDAFCYTVEEVREVARDNGFEMDEPVLTEMPYLKSPHNAGYRIERVWSWRAEKTADVRAQSGSQILPSWILDTQQPIPQTRYLQAFAQQHQMYGALAAEVNGKTSIKVIARRVAKQNRADPNEALEMVRNFFLEIYRQNHQG
jgi:uncharacterized protein YbaR (Trm112 family)